MDVIWFLLMDINGLIIKLKIMYNMLADFILWITILLFVNLILLYKQLFFLKIKEFKLFHLVWNYIILVLIRFIRLLIYVIRMRKSKF